jgi:hypothetical protein
MNCDYEGFEIKSFEVGRGLWHARFRRADHEPVIIDDVLLPALDVGFAWPRKSGHRRDGVFRAERRHLYRPDFNEHC